jgi:predicted O-methyltransferase YrrM
MDDHKITRAPAALEAILHDTQQLGFKMGSEPQTGALLRTLAATKPGGRFLELGTGTGIGTAWLLSGMDDNSRLDSVEIDSNVSDIARRHLGKDPRVTFHSADGIAFLKKIPDPRYDLVYADTWPGKFTHLELALSLVRVGGIYFIDDLLPQPTWPAEHASKIRMLIDELEKRPDFVATRLAWSSGIMVLVRTKI